MKYYTHVAKYGNNILCRGKDENGKSVSETIKYKPSLYIQTDNKSYNQYKDFYGGRVAKKTFNTMYEMTQFAKEYRSMDNYVWGNTKCDIQFIYDMFKNIDYNPRDIRSAFIDIEVMTRQKLNDGSFVNGGFPVASEAAYPINAICHYDSIDKVYYQFGLNCEWDKNKSVFPNIAEKTVYYNCLSEEELLKKWISFFNKKCPDIITGWNVETFDIPYIVNRVRQVLGMTWVKQLSPWQLINEREVRTQYGVDSTYDIVGISTLDYLALYKKHTFKNRESYTLDYISKCELGADTHKMEFQGTHGEFYWNDPQGFYDYNLRDVELVKHLDDKLQLIDLVVSLAYYSGINYLDTFSPIKTWDSIIYRKCLDNNVIIPLGDNKKHREEYPGAWVFDTKVGFQKAIASFDFASLYPSLNRSFNIGADTLMSTDVSSKIKTEIIKKCIENNDSELANLCSSNTPFNEYYLEHNKIPDYVTDILKSNKVSCTPNWQFYATDKESIFTTLQTELYKGRKSDKKQMQDFAHKAQAIEEEIQKLDSPSKELLNLLEEYSTKKTIYATSQLVKKILLNSLYGATGSPYFRFYDARNAAATTLSGQLFIRNTEKAISSYINKITQNKKNDSRCVAGDTDSVAFDTNIYVNEQKITISDFYDTLSENEYIKNENDNYVKKVENCYTKTIDNDKIINTPIKYIMKHKVKKQMYSLTIDGRKIRITADHSLIVERDKQIISVKPTELRPYDNILYITLNEVFKSSKWILEDEGVKEEWVYDIETENHMFLGNDILVHNSVYIDVHPILVAYKMDHKSVSEKTIFLDVCCKTIEKECINPLMILITENLNTYQNCMSMDREVICVGAEKTNIAGFWCAKKHYALLVNDNEGYRYDDSGHLKVMGLSMVQSSTPEYFRDKLSNIVTELIAEGPDTVRRIIKETYNEFVHKPVEDIALPRSVSNVTKYESSSGPIKGTPIQSKAAIYFNTLLKKYKLEKEIEPIRDGDKLKFVYLKTNPHQIDVIGFKNTLPEQFGLHKYADYDTHFNKAFLKPISDIFESCALEIEERSTVSEFF